MKVIKQKNHKDFKTIQCKKVDPIKDFKMDNRHSNLRNGVE